MEIGAIVFLAAFVVFVIEFISFTSYSKENEELVGGIIVNSWRTFLRLIKGEMENENEEETRFESQGFCTDGLENELFKDQDPNLLDLIYPYYLDAIDKDRLKAMEDEFNNDCA